MKVLPTKFCLCKVNFFLEQELFLKLGKVILEQLLSDLRDLV